MSGVSSSTFPLWAARGSPVAPGTSGRQRGTCAFSPEGRGSWGLDRPTPASHWLRAAPVASDPPSTWAAWAVTAR